MEGAHTHTVFSTAHPKTVGIWVVAKRSEQFWGRLDGDIIATQAERSLRLGPQTGTVVNSNGPNLEIHVTLS